MTRAALHVLTHNSAAQLDPCLAALLAQDYLHLTVTIIDNASTDDTLARLAPWRARGVRVVAFARNHFYARAHNEIIAEAEAEVIFTVNPDVLLAPDFVSTIMAVFARAPEVGSVNGRLVLLAEEEFATTDPAAPAPDDAIIDSAGLMIFRSRRPWLRGNRQPGARRLRGVRADLRGRWGLRGLSPRDAGGSWRSTRRAGASTSTTTS